MKPGHKISIVMILFCIVLFPTIIAGIIGGCEDSRGEKPLDWICKDCKAQFPLSEHVAFREHVNTDNCRAFRKPTEESGSVDLATAEPNDTYKVFLSDEDQWKLTRLAEDLEKYGINYPAEPNIPVWGQGNPPDNWQSFFGNENIARLNFVQTQMLNKQEKDMVLLIERVRVLEDANTCIANTFSTTSGKPEYCIHNPDPNGEPSETNK
ncbi:hypothetical protein LCGC14_2146590 [marine sediment metagenome]|uniref:Uncharacterized protein n=1 Tax=marine sediment metagenome TaxID=412755 RepID=A0A0F9G9P6_9ZZZZ